MTGHGTLPNWVVKHDGRLAPFDGDKICRSIFDAGERVGCPNPFLARELTDGILHFLTADRTDAPLPTAEIAEATVKTVRELGQPALALTYEQYRSAKNLRPAPPLADGQALQPVVNLIEAIGAEKPSAAELTRRLATQSLAAFSRAAVFSRHLVAAERDGLLSFFDADTPLELTGGVVRPLPPATGSASGGWVDAIEAARERVGQFIAIDGPEYLLASLGSHSATTAWVRELRLGLRLTGLRAVVNLNCQSPPRDSSEEAVGPLFAALSTNKEFRYDDGCDYLLDCVIDSDFDGLRVDWHLNERDFASDRRGRLLRLAKRMLDGAPLAFVYDHPRRPIALAEGLDRQHTSVLSTVGVSLPRLAEIVRSTANTGVDPTVYLAKLGSLARLALSAGRARRDFLRSHARPEATHGFELDRARLVVVPIGLAEAVETITTRPQTAGSPSLEFARQVLQCLKGAISQGRSHGLPACVDNLPTFRRKGAPAPAVGGALGAAMVGTTRQQVRIAGTLHTEMEAGTAEVRLPAEHRPAPEEIAHLLWYAWQQPGLVRIRFVRAMPGGQQLSAGWDVPPSP